MYNIVLYNVYRYDDSHDETFGVVSSKFQYKFPLYNKNWLQVLMFAVGGGQHC